MAQLETVVIKITGDPKELNKTIDKLEKVGKVDKQNADQFKKSNAQFQAGTKQSSTLLKGLKTQALALGAALIGAFAIQRVVGGAIKILKDLEKELSTLQSITGRTVGEMKFFEKAAIDIGIATKTASVDVVRAFTQIGSAQPELLKNSAALADVTEQALILGKAAGINATQAAMSLTGAMNQWGVSAKEAAKFTDILATSQQKGSSFIADTTEALVNSGAAAVASGLSFETANAAIQALAKGNIKGARAGTAFRGVLQKLAKQNDDTINPSIVGLAKVLENLEKRNLTLADATKLVQEEGATGLLTMIKQIDLFNSLDGSLNETGNAMSQMLINTDNLDGSLEELNNAWERFVLNLKGSDGVLRDTTDLFTDFLNILSERGIIDALTAFSLSAFGVNEQMKESIKIEKELESLERKRISRVEKFAEINLDLAVNQEELNQLQSEAKAVQADLNTLYQDGKITYEQYGQAGITVNAVLNDQIKVLKEEDEAVSSTTKTVGDLKKEVAELKKAQDTLILGSKELANNQRRVKEIQDLLKVSTKDTTEEAIKLAQAFSNFVKKVQSGAPFVSKEWTKAMGIIRAQMADIGVLFSGEDEENIVEDADFLIKVFQDTIEGRRQLSEIALKGELISQAEHNANLKELDDELRAAKIENVQSILDIADFAANGIFKITAQLNKNQFIEFENRIKNEEKALKKKFEFDQITSQQFEQGQKDLRDKADKERAELLTKQAKNDQAAAIIAATINTAVAVTATLEVPVLAAIVAVLGAVEIATIAAQPIPEFHKGRKGKRSDAEIPAIVKESEYIMHPEASRKHSQELDAMLAGRFEQFVYQKYQKPIIQHFSKQADYIPYNDMEHKMNQKKQIKLLMRNNELLKLSMSNNHNPHRYYN